MTSENLPGKSFLQLLTDTQKSTREGALFCYEMLSMSAPNFIKPDGSGVSYNFRDMGRGMLRALITSNGYKFARYFKPGEFNTPETFEALFASNDVQLFDTNKDPDELDNLASPEKRREHEALIMEMNSLMNYIVEEEVSNNDNGEHVLNPLREYLNGE